MSVPYYAPPSDVPTPNVLPVNHGFAATWSHFSNVNWGSATGPAANQAIYVPFYVTERKSWDRGFWFNGSVATNAGNASVGVYDTAGNQRATTGNVAASGNSIIQTAVFTASVTLDPGTYYMAIEFSASGVNSTTGWAASAISGRLIGAYTQAVGSNPLPATATFATWSSMVIPVYGISALGFAI